MAQAINVQRDFHRPLLSIEAVLYRVVNPKPVLRHSNYQPTLDQQSLIELKADIELPELCDSKDVVIAVLEGRGSLVAVGHIGGEFVISSTSRGSRARTAAG